MFHRPKVQKKIHNVKPLTQLIAVETPETLLSDAKRKTLLSEMEHKSAFDQKRFKTLFLSLIHHFIDYVQSLPETSNSYYTLPCGLLDHALNRTEAAISLFRQFVVEEEVLSEEQLRWLYVLFSASILQGIGKLYLDYHIKLYNGQGHEITVFNPLLTSLASRGTHYDYEFVQQNDDDYRRRLNLLLAQKLMPEEGFSWIASHHESLRVWLALIHEDWPSAGTLGAILVRADAIAIQRFFNEWIKTFGARGGRKARMGTFIDTTPDEAFDKERAMASEFILWLMKALQEGHVMINQSPLFIVPGGMLMSADIFKLFIREHPEFKNWQAVQNAFLSLNLHSPGVDNQPISRFEQLNNQSMISGVVFAQYTIALPERVQVYNQQTNQATTESALNLMHKAGEAVRLQQLNGLGEWTTPKAPMSFLQPGSKKGG